MLSSVSPVLHFQRLQSCSCAATAPRVMPAPQHPLVPDALQLRSEALSDNTKGGEPLSSLWERVLRAWKQVVEAAQAQGGQTVAVVGHSGVIAAMLCMCLGLGQDRVSMFR